MSQFLNRVLGKNQDYGSVQFWHQPERQGWLMKQDGKIFWFKTDIVNPDTVPRGIIEVNKCLSIKGAEDAINKPHAFEISTTEANMFFIADTDKEKEDWINAVGRAIVRHSRSMMDRDAVDYNNY
ncbi:hypothetical protein N2152v2_008998 [Parachlorella kessleri]